jgi:hypothetical protein
MLDSRVLTKVTVLDAAGRAICSEPSDETRHPPSATAAPDALSSQKLVRLAASGATSLIRSALCIPAQHVLDRKTGYRFERVAGEIGHRRRLAMCAPSGTP